ncbi:MAG: prolyl-tRNA synthetase associated domain-containing protein [Clostridiaceae bacterium]|nr:prolyl-tRNA synthetase associated domain-containing protein [Clostridiaceae bacterium]
MFDNRPLFDMLDMAGVKYEKVEHPDVHTMQDLEPIEKKLGARFFRNLFLSNRQKTQYYLLLIVGDKPFRTAEVSKLLGVARLSFGSEDILEQMLGVSPGAVNPLSLIFDPGHKITLVADRDILKSQRVCMHPGSNSQSVVMQTSDLFDKVLPRIGVSPVWIDIKGEA